MTTAALLTSTSSRPNSVTARVMRRRTCSACAMSIFLGPHRIPPLALVRLNAEQLVHSDESIPLCQQRIGGQLDRAHGFVPVAAAAVEAVVKDQYCARSGLGNGAPGNAPPVGLE